MSKNKTFEFTPEQIEFVKSVKKLNRINTVQGDKVQAIWRKQIDANFNMCTGCKGSVAKYFSQLVAHIEKSIGGTIEEYGQPKKAAKKPAAKKKPATKKPGTPKKNNKK